MNMIRVVVFDDSPSRIKSLSLLINHSENMRSVGEFGDCVNALLKIEETQPDVVLMDINMPTVDGIEGVKIIRKKYPSLCIIMQTVFEDDDKIISAISAGANGYIIKKTHPSKIIDAINEVINGGSPMTPAVARRVLELFHKKLNFGISQDYKLTDREKEVLSDLVKGLSYKMVADERKISVYTVNAHVRKIYEKLQVHSVAEAVSKAISNRII
ncbi:MAG: response regulator transcription factor [Chitinophagaceae bacterium]|nr:response regulator transcription factor [Chitinophagaceae bacterium]MCW5925659.1 response regulator transcription factor [Chitinophagaceae bacterium]